MKEIQANEILEAIHKANCFFHLNYEKDKGEKNRFYRIKDTIVAEILKGRYPEISCTANGIQHDTEHSYVYLTLTAGGTSIDVHFPTERMPVGARYDDRVERDADGMPVPVPYHKDRSKYAEAEVDADEYARCMKTIDTLYGEIYSDRVDTMDDRTLRDMVCATSCKMGMKPIIHPDGQFVFDGRFVFCTTKKKQPLFTCKVSDIREAMKDLRTFNYHLLYHHLKVQGKLKKIKAAPAT